MGHYSRNFAAASGYLKVATFVSVLALLLHIVAFSTPNWSTVHLMYEDDSGKQGGRSTQWLQTSDHTGLWQRCSCLYSYNRNDCICIGRHGDPAWFKMVQVVETLFLIGLLTSGLLSVMQLCVKQDRKLKRVNTIINIASGLSGGLGLIVYGMRSHYDMNDALAYFGEHEMNEGYIDYSYYVCSCAAILYLFVCAPLFLKDNYLPIVDYSQDNSAVDDNQVGQNAPPFDNQPHQGMACIGQDNCGFIQPIADGPYYPPPAYSECVGPADFDFQHEPTESKCPLYDQ